MARIGKYHARHSWARPRIGDDSLRCLTCDRVLLFMEMTPHQVNSILRTRRQRYSDGHLFQSALVEARCHWMRESMPFPHGVAA